MSDPSPTQAVHGSDAAAPGTRTRVTDIGNGGRTKIVAARSTQDTLPRTARSANGITMQHTATAVACRTIIGTEVIE